jgi:hypothetical protein
MIKQALVLGCSHAAGSEMGSDDYGLNNSYPMLIAEQLGYSANNCAVDGGGSNDAMFRIFESEYKNYNVVIACWSGHNRTEVWHESKQVWVPFCPGGTSDLDKYRQQWILHQTDATTGRLNKIKNILALNAIAQAHNITVINIDSFWSVTEFTWPNNVYWPVPDSFWDWANTQGFQRTEWGHFQKDAHTAFADYILENMAS